MSRKLARAAGRTTGGDNAARAGTPTPRMSNSRQRRGVKYSGHRRERRRILAGLWSRRSICRVYATNNANRSDLELIPDVCPIKSATVSRCCRKTVRDTPRIFSFRLRFINNGDIILCSKTETNEHVSNIMIVHAYV